MDWGLPMQNAISHSSTVEPDWGTQIYRPRDGIGMPQKVNPNRQYRITLIWDRVTRPQLRQIQNTLRYPRGFEFQLFDDWYHSARLVDGPRIDRVAPNRYTVTAELTGRRFDFMFF